MTLPADAGGHGDQAVSYTTPGDRISRTLRISIQMARLRLLVWRLLATRAALRLVGHAVDWLAPPG